HLKQGLLLVSLLFFSCSIVYSGNKYKTKNYTYSSFKNDFSSVSFSNETFPNIRYNYKSARYYSPQFLSNLNWDANFTAAAILNGICLTGLGVNALTQDNKFTIDNYIYIVGFEVGISSLLIWNHYR
ncbi:MAG: hypothetical protein R6V16_04495, partial [Bacteroidales bacterium]